MKLKPDEDYLVCSFCERDIQDDPDILFLRGTANTMICETCVLICVDAIKERKNE